LTCAAQLFAIDAACSSSMHALHLAVQSIRLGESETGHCRRIAPHYPARCLGVYGKAQVKLVFLRVSNYNRLKLTVHHHRLFSNAGKTYAFDHRAESGYARGEGAGCVVLKPLDRALADNDHIRAVITHTAISHNGRTVGLAAPSAEEQEQLLRDVFAASQNQSDRRRLFSRRTVLARKKGDPVEATAIYKAVVSNSRPTSRCT